VVQGSLGTFQGSWLHAQQAAMEAVRAMETGRPAVLGAMSGTSAAFNARGRLLLWQPHQVTGAFLVTVPLVRVDTPTCGWATGRYGWPRRCGLHRGRGRPPPGPPPPRRRGTVTMVDRTSAPLAQGTPVQRGDGCGAPPPSGTPENPGLNLA
jgi:hypothetical protein